MSQSAYVIGETKRWRD